MNFLYASKNCVFSPFAVSVGFSVGFVAWRLFIICYYVFAAVPTFRLRLISVGRSHREWGPLKIKKGSVSGALLLYLYYFVVDAFSFSAASGSPVAIASKKLEIPLRRPVPSQAKII